VTHAGRPGTKETITVDIDRYAMVRAVEERLAVTANERHRAQLALIREHMRAEVAQDVDAIMATITEGSRVRYRTWGVPLEWMQPESREAVRRYYLANQANGDLYLEFAIERIAVDDGLVITDGVMTSLVPGATMRSRGVAGAADDDVFAVRTRMLVSWPFDENGKLIGEETYTVPLSAERVPPGEVPGDYWDQLTRT
jgi:hypothetical protein